MFQLISVILIDFNYEGKPGRRSLDQVSYQDEVRARNNLKDSYGNPVEYDTLEAIDAKLPSKNKKDPNKFIIPGYASGILQPHEVPSRSNFAGSESRNLEDDRVHFIDPLQNAYQKSDKPIQTPFASLSPPGTKLVSANTQQNLQPINIPRPNIDAQETPQVPQINDPLNGPLNPPQNDNAAGAPSFSLSVPNSNKPQHAVAQDLIPPQIPTDGQGGVLIPKPNLGIFETPIDNRNGPLNQGLLPPSESISSNPTTANPFKNTGLDGPVLITDVNFAPKPSNGLLPPKDPSPNDINFQSPDNIPPVTTQNKFVTPINQTGNKFTGSFNGAQGVLGQAIDKIKTNVESKFSGSFGGHSQGVLSGPRPQLNQIPVTVLQSPEPTQAFPPTTEFVAAKPIGNKYQGNFGGAPGVLVSDNLPAAQTTSPLLLPSVSSTLTTTPLDNRFSGSFGGVLDSNNQPPAITTSSQKPLDFNNVQPTQALPQLPPLTKAPAPAKQKYTGNFGGPPGVLKAFDSSV